MTERPADAASAPSTTPVPPVLRTTTVGCPADVAFSAFTDSIGAWWPLPTHGVFGARSGGLRFTEGRLVEIAIDGSETTWAEVLTWEPPTRLLLRWHPGRNEGPASRVAVTFTAVESGTRVEIRHDGWERFGDDALNRRRSFVGPNAWGYVCDHFADLIEGRSDAADLTGLAAAYEDFFTEAEQGQFGPPPAGEWTAEQVVAHVALNDLAISAVGHALVHGESPLFENHTCQDPTNLAAVVASCGDLTTLIGFARECAQQAMRVLSRLGTDQRGRAVHCRLEHDGAMVLDEPRPWGVIALDLQAGMHLPAHLEQLQKGRLSAATSGP